MDEALEYLKTSLGVNGEVVAWDGTANLPLYLRESGPIGLVETEGGAFLLMRPQASDLPSIKRAYRQLQTRVDAPVAMCVPSVDARQRRALAVQKVPFICPYKQVFLPFLGMESKEWGREGLRVPSGILPFRAQQAAIWGALKQGPYTLHDLREATGISAAAASKVVAELAARGLVERTKRGKTLHVMPMGADGLLREHVGELASPVVRTMFVRRVPCVDALPDAGETALAMRSALNAPRIKEKAAPRSIASELHGYVVAEGEIPDDQMAYVQIWRYQPLYSGHKEIDSISLALSLAHQSDERVQSELDTLFGRGYQWGAAR